MSIEFFRQISMGQGQLDVAIEALQWSAANGGWLCLKNLHLVPLALPVIHKV